MHSLLGFRYDQLMHEQLTKRVNQPPSIKLFSIRLLVKDLNKEKEFFAQLLGIAPLAESSEYVILSISPDITLSLMSFPKLKISRKDYFLSRVSGLEFNLETKDIQSMWNKALAIKGGQPSELVADKNSLMFSIKSPVGLRLNLWQKWAMELSE